MKSIFKFLILIGLISGLQSCGDDDVTGCMDASAENFDPNATVSGDCVFARDNFIDSYLGSLVCPSQLAFLSNDSISFEIIEGLDSGQTSEVILNIMIDGLPLAISGQVEEDTLTLMQVINNVPIPTPLGTSDGDVTALGMATIDNSTQNLNATLNINVMAEVLGMPRTFEDNCTITGVRQ